jgi:hypothetical protein
MGVDGLRWVWRILANSSSVRFPIIFEEQPTRLYYARGSAASLRRVLRYLDPVQVDAWSPTRSLRSPGFLGLSFVPPDACAIAPAVVLSELRSTMPSLLMMATYDP